MPAPREVPPRRRRRKRRTLPSPPEPRPWVPDGIWGSAGLIWRSAGLPICAARTAGGTFVVVDRTGTSLFFETARAAKALAPQVARSPELARCLGCPYVWGERTTVFAELFAHKGRGITSELGAAKAMQGLIAAQRARVKPAPSGITLRDALLQPVLPRILPSKFRI